MLYRQLVVLGLLVGATAGHAQSPLLPQDAVEQFYLQRPSSAYAQSTLVSAAGQPFGQAVRVATLVEPENAWNVQLNLKTSAPIAKEDVLLATFYHRVEEPAGIGGFTVFVFEQAGSPWTKSANQTVSIGSSEWQKTQIAFEAVADYPTGGAQVNFQLGFPSQTVEIGGVEVVNFQKSKTLEEVQAMIDSALTYPGREPDAPWRAEAHQRIDQFRKADLTLEIVDGLGQPIPGVPVKVQMKRHAFGFGSAVAAATLLERTRTAIQYRSVVTNSFNRVVIENNLKWPQWEQSREQGIAATQWLVDHRIPVRGHNILWPSWRHLPTDVEGLAHDVPALRQRINAHITDITQALSGSLVDWDVVNEPYSEHDLMDLLGWDEMVSWFALARSGDPSARLYLNDYSILAATGTGSSHQDHYFDTIQALLTAGAPLDGIGMQGHFQSFLTPPTTLYAVLERFKAFGLPIQVTEFDLDLTDRELQADYLRDFMTLVFSHPSAEAILMWGFWEGRHWRPEAALYDLDWNLRPHGEVWYQLVFDDWWTEEIAQTDQSGFVTVRGFKGDYQVTVGDLEESQRAEVTLLDDHRTTIPFVPNRPLLQLERSPERHNIRVLKTSTEPIEIQASEDLNGWTSIETNRSPALQIEFSDPDFAQHPSRFYRARIP